MGHAALKLAMCLHVCTHSLVLADLDFLFISSTLSLPYFSLPLSHSLPFSLLPLCPPALPNCLTTTTIRPRRGATSRSSARFGWRAPAPEWCSTSARSAPVTACSSSPSSLPPTKSSAPRSSTASRRLFLVTHFILWSLPTFYKFASYLPLLPSDFCTSTLYVHTFAGRWQLSFLPLLSVSHHIPHLLPPSFF